LDSGDIFGGVDVIADQLRMVAAIGIGTALDAIETTVTTLSARATSGGIYLLESDDLIIDNTSTTIQRVNFDNTLTEIDDGTQSDVRTTAGHGTIVIRTLNGDIT